MRGPRGAGGLLDGLPHPLAQLQILDVLGDLAQVAEQAPWVEQGSNRRGSKRRGRAEPILLPDLHKNPVGRFLNRDCHPRLAPRGRAGTSPDLYRQVILLSQNLGTQTPAVKLGDQGLGKVRRRHFTVIDSLIHNIDYNREAISLSYHITR